MKRFATTLAAALVLTAFAVPASADQADKDACVGLEEGDECTDGDGRAGFCEWDESDAVLSCDDDGPSSSAASSGCSTSGRAADPLSLLGVVAALAFARARRHA